MQATNMSIKINTCDVPAGRRLGENIQDKKNKKDRRGKEMEWFGQGWEGGNKLKGLEGEGRDHKV